LAGKRGRRRINSYPSRGRRNAEEFSTQTVQLAERFYCISGHSFSEVSDITGVSPRQLKHWGKKLDWTEKRRENSRIIHEIGTKKNLLREKLLHNCLETAGPRDVIAFVAMESLARKTAMDDAKRGPDPRGKSPGEPAATVRDGIEALEKACLMRMNQLAADPKQLDVRVIRGIEAGLEMAGRYKRMLIQGQSFLDEALGRSGMQSGHSRAADDED